MGCKIIFAPEALGDLAAAVRYIARDDPQTAKRVGDSLIDRVAILENFPLIGSKYPKSRGVMRLVSPPFIIFYTADVNNGCVSILRYWHSARGEPQF